MSRKRKNTAFTLIVGLFSVLLFLLSLTAGSRLNALNDRAAWLRQETAELKKENGILRAEYESAVGLPEIERYAREVLGMTSPGPGQRVTLPVPEK